MLLSRARSAIGRTLPRSTLSRAYGTSLPVPNPPEGTGAVFHSRMTPVKYSLSNPKWFILFFASNLGVYLGHYFYLSFLMSRNPPNPPRNPDEERPEKHMHTVDE
eukprot:gnl/TRDRNA2_/TRDRNA2_194783_c0_seq1.p2 gnl/TRDRNA2_/TRDRNA2_194783_c0~~gnl/TRDRNA2_/TRDRNA2_194783_c0_seq1.p2  ORF type:complete len:105 (+),score=9.22 gnl/TRDRNA2_/TRDRNA2_194783_c0_seq1:73-387(+)